MGKKNLALGRGLGAILSEVGQAYENNFSDNSELVVELDVDNIKPNPYQPRKHFSDESVSELSQSILEHGLLQPVLVYEDENNDYVLIAGERRLRATKLAGIKTIKAIIVEINLNKLREIALIENIQREDLNIIDLANSYKELINDYQITHEELAKRIKKSRAQITNTLRILNLSAQTQEMLIDEKISQGHAKILVALEPKEQKIVLDSIVGQKLSVRDTEFLVRKLKDENQSKGKSSINLNKNKSSKLASDSEIETLIKLFKNYFISASIKNNQLVLNLSNKSKINEIVNKLS
ncbi:chromosome partitioning protein ParB [Helicobacter sp. 13S00482-2]|uniref:ParB/RepB/Spo0J family partition protein n=1 Tax=Helicobacter sp. 13S00482-2 TaxID=1476200 RepID=UPI000BA739FC|nr:ParB/RepB/Spo0J family partition protein [Helicobacter sp. 13S00482-2]PAF53459.1 chromosome partitioning protein ParB [Helicobacter sp. 13S00482-2]